MIIYKVTNNFNGKSYIGQTARSLEERKWEHLYKKSNNGGSLLHKAIHKYGWRNFEWRVLAEFQTKEELDRMEMFFIKFWETKVPNGYNLTDGGEGPNGNIMSDETKRKLSIANKGKTYSEEYKCKMSEALKGRKLSEEWKRKIGKALKGRKFSEETIRKMSEALRGRTAWNKGIPRTEEEKRKMSENHRGHPCSEETKAKLSAARLGEKNPFFGKYHSEKTKTKISEAFKGKKNRRCITPDQTTGSSI